MTAHLMSAKACRKLDERSGVLAAVLVTLVTSSASAQEATGRATSPEVTDDAAKEPPSDDGIHGLSFVPLPVIAANPTAGWLFGIAPSLSWLMGPDASTRRSSAIGTAIYTTKKQLMFFLKSNVFLSGDRWNLMGDWRYFDTSQPTFGLGTGSPSATLASSGFQFDDGSYTNGIDEAQMMEFKYVRFHQTVLRRVAGEFFAGLGYHLDAHFQISDQLLDLSSSPPTLTSHYAYSASRSVDPEGYVLSGISLDALYDSRDNPINPYSGRYAFASWRVNPEVLGSDANSSLLWLEYRDYFNLERERPRHMIAVWAYGSFALSGTVPYLDLPAIGWDQFGRSGRAYTQGRFRGEHLLYAEAEYRFPVPGLPDRWGGVLFANATTASNEDADTALFEYIDPGAGLGVRFMLDEQARTNLTLDYAWGKYGAQGFYLNVNETF